MYHYRVYMYKKYGEAIVIDYCSYNYYKFKCLLRLKNGSELLQLTAHFQVLSMSPFFVSGILLLFYVTCKQHHMIALNPF